MSGTIGQIAAIFSAIVAVGMVAVIVGSKNTAGIISAWGTAFSQSMRAAMGH